MLVAAVQHDIVWEDAAATFALLEPSVASAAEAGAELVSFTEMFATGFSLSASRIAEEPDGPTTRFLSSMARRHGLWTAGSLPERTPGFERPTNRFVLAGPEGQLHRYSKIHPFSYAGEHRHYSAGVSPLTVSVNGVRVTPLVCYDLRFADLFWEAATRTDCYVVVANWPASRRLHWNALLRARAIENQAYVVGVNRVGMDGNSLNYAGDSVVFDPLGARLAYAGDSEAVITADVDPEKVASVRAEFPFLADRRT